MIRKGRTHSAISCMGDRSKHFMYMHVPINETDANDSRPLAKRVKIDFKVSAPECTVWIDMWVACFARALRLTCGWSEGENLLR